MQPPQSDGSYHYETKRVALRDEVPRAYDTDHTVLSLKYEAEYWRPSHNF